MVLLERVAGGEHVLRVEDGTSLPPTLNQLVYSSSADGPSV